MDPPEEPLTQQLLLENARFRQDITTQMRALESAVHTLTDKLDTLLVQLQKDRAEFRAFVKAQSANPESSPPPLKPSSSSSERRLSQDQNYFTIQDFANSPRPVAHSTVTARSALRRLFDFKGHLAAVVGMAFSSQGDLLGTASADKSARIWNAITGSLVHTLVGHTDYVRAIAFSPDSSLIATGSSDNHVFLWSCRDGSRLNQITLSVDVCAVNFSLNGQYLVVGSGEHLALYDPQSDLQHPVKTIHSVSSRNVYAAVFSPSCKLIAAGTDTFGSIFSLQDSSLMAKLPHQSIVVDINFCSDESRVATASWDKTARVWSVSTGECQCVLLGHTSWVNAVSWSPDGSVLATASSDCTVAVWDMTGRRMCVASLPKPCTSLAWSPVDDVCVVGCKDAQVVQYRWA